MKDIDKFRQEIKRLRKEIKDEKDPLALNQKAGYLFALTDMESFLDTFSEEPDTPEFPETFEICLYDGRIPDNEKYTECSTTCSVRKEEPDKSLEEAAKEYEWSNVDTNQLNPPTLDMTVQVGDLRNAFIAGAKWQARQLLQGSPMPEDTVLFQKGVAEGRRLEREDVMKDAADIKITRDTLYTLKPFILEKYLEYKIGKTAKLLLIQEDEK